jgi:hypothetical protein
MSRIVVLVLICLIGFAGCAGSNISATNLQADKAASEVTFGSSWNSHCGSCNFATNAGVTLETTLGDMYNGSNFNFDIDLMDILISRDLGSPSGLHGAEIGALYIWYDDDADDPL